MLGNSRCSSGRASSAMHVEFLLEEESAAVAVDTILKRLNPNREHGTWHIQPFRGKPDLLRKLRPTMASIARAGYADRVIVLLDADREDCVELKERIVRLAEDAGLISEPRSYHESPLRVRVAVTELECWFIGDPEALGTAFGRLTSSDLRLRGEVDDLQNAWEWLERRLIRRRHFVGRMRKKEVAGLVSQHMSLEPDHNTSRSFRLFLRTLREVYGLPT